MKNFYNGKTKILEAIQKTDDLKRDFQPKFDKITKDINIVTGLIKILSLFERPITALQVLIKFK